MITLSLPLALELKNKRFLLNLNVYRNAHFYILNEAKVTFKDLVRPLILSLVPMERVALLYTLYPRTLHKQDVSNVCSVVDKFFLDAMVESGKLPDDNYDHVPEVGYRFGEIDKMNPRVEVQIHNLE